jgi:predicted P-loop ATPase
MQKAHNLDPIFQKERVKDMKILQQNQQTVKSPFVDKLKSEVAKIEADSEGFKERLLFEEGKEAAMSELEEYIAENYNLRFNFIQNEIEISLLNSQNFSILNSRDLLRELKKEKIQASDHSLKITLNSSFVPRYNPITAYFENLPKWAGEVDHIANLASYVRASDRDFFNAQFKKMLVRVVACAIGKIAFNKQCLTFVGKQNDGKTSFVRFLCPPQLQGYFKENLDIDKDGRLALCQNLIINLDELATFSKSDINAIKTYFSLEKVKDRPPYGEKPITFNRTASFFASTNNKEFLTDETGNVRWLVFEIDGIQHDNGGANGYTKNININDVWAQAVTLLSMGFDFKMTADEVAYSEKMNNQNFRKATYEMELMEQHFTPATKEDHELFYTAANILEDLQFGRLVKINHVQIGKALTALGFTQGQKYNAERKYQQKGYFLKRVKTI